MVASISFFKEGIELLYEVFDKAKSRREYGTIKEEAAAGAASAEAVSLTRGMRKLELPDLDATATLLLANAKKRFESARTKATEAFANEALELSDRVLALQYRVMATILETVDNPEVALAACRVCIEELHSMSAVKECFAVEFKRGFWARFSKDERKAIISATCHVNRTIYDVMLMVSFGNKQLCGNNWPCVDTGREKVDLLHDGRVANVLQKQGEEHCRVEWSFGQEGETQHKLKWPEGIATNADGHFITADYSDRSVKVFDSNGKFIFQFSPKRDDETALYVLDVATDVNSNMYVLVRLRKTGFEKEVQVFSNTADLLHRFRMRGGDRLAVTNNKVLELSFTFLSRRIVHVYDHKGTYIRSFGEGIWRDARDITASPNGQVMTLANGGSCVFVFSEDGQQHCTFNINTNEDEYWRIACHPSGEHVVVAGWGRAGTNHLSVAIYTEDGEFFRKIKLNEEKIFYIRGITVSREGHIAVAVDYSDSGKIIVL